MRISVFLLLLIFSFVLTNAKAQTNFWTKVDENNLRSRNEKRQIIPDKYQVFTFDYQSFIKIAQPTANRFSQSFTLDVPLPDGFAKFEMIETSVFDEALSAKYPGFTSYTGRSLDHPHATIKMSVSPFGINAMILDDRHSTVFIDPYTQHNLTDYIVYYKKDFRKKTGSFTCGVISDHQDEIIDKDIKTQQNTGSRVGDCVLRSYRLALACTGEYANYHGGTKEKVLAAYNNTMTRINGVYEKEASITMILIENTDQLIFLNRQTDPYTNNNGEAMLGENQTTINNIIGISNFDIGHVFSTAGGGIAQLRSPCTFQKARGVTGQPNPVGDPFDIDYVAHEMGHQFGANHTQNNACNRSGNTAVEPGSASTIMGYAGICAPNVQSNSQANFHAISLGEIANFVVAGNGNNCPTKIEIDNQKPSVFIEKNSYTIPISTSFVLTAIGEDADSDELTYCWEQMNNEIATMPPLATSSSGPSFRSLPPDVSPSRFFPDLQRRYTTWEVVPSVSRTMDFRCTVRDNNVLGGCTDEANVSIEFSNQAGPFVVTYPNAGSINWKVGSPQTVTWNVANTDKAPINCSLVNIFLSTDGGKTYPHLIAEKVPNNGSLEIITPSLPTNTARVMVMSDENIFYDVSNVNFQITSTFAIESDVNYVEVCDQTQIEIAINLTKLDNSNQDITLSLENPPSTLQFSFSPQVVSIPGNATFTILNPQSLNSGNNTLNLVATSGIEKNNINIDLFKGSDELVVVENYFPINFSKEIGIENINFEWSSIEGINKYQLEISQNPSFVENVTTYNTETNFFTTNLQPDQVYYWRVKAISPCIENEFGPTSSFQTDGLVNENGILLRNEVLLISSNESGLINNQKIDFASVDDLNANIIITKLPEHGLLSLDGEVLKIGSKISKSSILNESFTYQNNGDDSENDSFVFDIIDDLGRWLPNQTFEIKIRQSEIGVAAFLGKELLCFGDLEGSIFAEAYGGTPPYQYSLDNTNFQDEPIFENLSSGQYQIFVKDSQNETTISNTVLITSPSEIIFDAIVNNYNIILNASGGAGNLLFSLDNNTYSFIDSILDPGNGEYTIFVKDANDCLVSRNLSINIPNITANLALENQIMCPTDQAILTAVVEGGIEPYVYSINGIDFQISSIFNLASGEYVVFIKDAGNKIFKTDTVKVNGIENFAFTFEQNDFEFTFNITGGTPPYLFGTTADTLGPNNTFVFSGNGTFRIYVQDSKLCEYNFTFSINQFTNVNRTVRNVTCHGQNNGFLRLAASNGISPFLYQLNQSDFTSQREWNNLSAGEYTFAVIDSRNDTVTGNVIIAEPDSLVVEISIADNNLLLTTTGGTPPYRHSLDGGDVFLATNQFNDLPSGTYTIVVRDDNNCLSAEQVLTLTSTADFSNHQDISITPNPSDGNFKITSEIMSDPSAELSVVDILGKPINVLTTKSQHLNEVYINMEHVPNGMYLLIINAQGKKWSAKMVKM